MMFICCNLAASVTYLYQSDFDNGTYIIDTPGKYKLAEDISFNPNSAAMLGTDAYEASFPLYHQFKSQGGPYDERAFGIGFFAAIVVAANHVELDLNGHTIEQSAEHALLQRFFAVIETADQPFVPAQGPSDFGSNIISAEHLTIKNGTIGRSSHHGIHGNGNKHVKIQNVHFQDFEVAAVALNGVKGLEIKNCTAASREDVPVLGTFSSAQFIKQYINYLVMTGSSTTLDIGGGASLSAADIQNRLRSAINRTHDDIIVKDLGSIDSSANPDEYALFHNKWGVVDGNSYGFLVNNRGVAVNGFPSQPTGDAVPSKNIKFKNVHVLSLRAAINEIVALNQGGKAAIDPVGAVFQVRNLHPDTGVPLTISSLDDSLAVYVGNLVANAQAFVAKAAQNGDFAGSFLDISRLNITSDIIDWIEAPPASPTAKLAHLAPTEADYFCNGDSMFHVNKGVIAFKMDAAKNVEMKNTSASNVENLGEIGNEICGDYIKSHPAATLEGYGGAIARGYSFSGSKNVDVKKSYVINLRAKSGSAIAFDILTDSENVEIKNSWAQELDGGYDFVPNGSPTVAKAIGFHVSADADKVSLKKVCASSLMGYDSVDIVDDESGDAKVKKLCD
jgi:hypothetical protein